MRLLPENIASFGGSMDSLIVLITVLTGIGLVVSELVLVYALVRYRRRRAPRAAYLTGEGWNQTRWVLMPVLLVLGTDLYIDLRTHDTWQEVKGQLPPADVNVRLTGQQFTWMVTYAGMDGKLDTGDDFQKAGDLRVPVEANVVFALEARDVLHSFWVPALRLKQDAVPGRTIHGWFRATTTGAFDVACAELCGPGHTLMKSTLHVLPRAEYDAWIASGGEDQVAAGAAPLSADAAAGKALLGAKGCTGCHSVDGSALIGPSYQGMYGRQETVVEGATERTVTVDEAYLRRSILEPAAQVVKGYQPVMPPMAGLLTDAEVGQIIAYLQTLQ